MALESVDLLSLLKRARKSGGASPVADLAEAVENAVPETPPAPTPATVPPSTSRMQVPMPPAATPAPAPVPQPVPAVPSPALKAREEAELADLRAELISDEVLIQRILGLLYRCKKKNPSGGFISILDMEKTLNIEREGASFVMSYMKTLKIIEMDDKSRMAITVPGIEYLRSFVGLEAASSRANSAPE